MSGTISPRDRLQLWVNTFLLKQKENSGSVTATFREKPPRRLEVRFFGGNGPILGETAPNLVCLGAKEYLLRWNAPIFIAKGQASRLPRTHPLQSTKAIPSRNLSITEH